MVKEFKYIFLVIFILFGICAKGQDITVEGYFMKDSAKLGERVPYVLKAKYRSGINLVFPDSSHNFEPFVLLEKRTFITSTQDNLTLDSAVYFVSNFSLDPVAKLALPVYEVLRYDSITHLPDEADLALKLTIDPLPEQLQFRDNNIYQPIPTSINYFMIGLILVIVTVLTLVILWFFGTRLKKLWSNWQEKRRYNRFSKKWKLAEKEFSQKPDMENADSLLGLWKTYMEYLENKPFREWTTSEIAEFLDNKEIIKDFRNIEMVIYAGKEGERINETCQNLQEVCMDALKKKLSQQDESK